MPDIATLWHTLRHLRPVQFYARAWFRFVHPRPDLRPAPPLRATSARWRSGCARASSMIAADTFRFLGVERRIAEARDWDRADWPALWRYNAHYFDDLVATDAESRSAWHEALIARWMAENPPARGIGWDPYPTSLRIVNWIKRALAGHALGDASLASLAAQTRHLRRRLEFHLLGNHLLANAKALVFAGTFFEGREAEAWRARGLALLRRELAEQVLADGGHVERSPMYHAIVLEDVLDVIALSRVYADVYDAADVERWRKLASRMLRWLRVMSHPDGDIAFFNDAAFGIAPDAAALAEYAKALDIAADATPLADIERLDASGYVRLQAPDAVAILDVGRIGPDYQPGHAHADTLSFELSIGGARVFVNGGTSTYELGTQRTRERSTAMHNTVEVDGADSSVVWHAFRVAQRATPFDVRIGADGATRWVEAAHDGYRRLPGRVVHRRRIELRDGRLVVIDRLEGRFRAAVARFRLHPRLTTQIAADGAGAVLDDGRRVLEWQVSGAASANVVEGRWHPRFGASENCCVIEIALEEPLLQTTFTWR